MKERKFLIDGGTDTTRTSELQKWPLTDSMALAEKKCKKLLSKYVKLISTFQSCRAYRLVWGILCNGKMQAADVFGY